MGTNTAVIKALREKEGEIIEAIRNSELYKQLEALRATIAMMKPDYGGESVDDILFGKITLSHRNVSALRGWDAMIIAALQKLGEGTVRQIVEEIKMTNPDTNEAPTLKRVTVRTSVMKKEGLLKAISVDGNRFIYTLINNDHE